MALAFCFLPLVPFVPLESQAERIHSALPSLPPLPVSLLICTCNRAWQIYVWGFGCWERDSWQTKQAERGSKGLLRRHLQWVWESSSRSAALAGDGCA